LDGLKDGGKGWVERVCSVQMRVAEVFDVLGEVAEEEDVVFADLAGDFNL
jgi:hypothetical protein